MKKRQIIGLVLITLYFASCKVNYTSKDYLNKVLNNLDKIESASCNTIAENWNPGDTAASAIYYEFIQEYNNPSDTTIGAKFVKYEDEDTLKIKYCYDGEKRAKIYHEYDVVIVDSFKVRKLPFRPVNPPFFNYTKSILEYAINTNDSIMLDIKNMQNTVYLKLTINENNKVEFFGKPIYMPITPYSYDNTSIFEIWINKDDNLPYKVRREMSHNISVTTCKNYELNNLKNKGFIADDYFPENYEIVPYKLGRRNKEIHSLIDKKAPDWILQTADKSSISLTDLKSKVLMIQFTSVSCGPCKASIPFLKELSTEYEKDDFDFVAIECTSKNTNVLKSYMDRNDFDYKFLLSTKDVLKKYSITSFPVFFILDENRNITNVINGYRQEKTDKKIKTLINDLI